MKAYLPALVLLALLTGCGAELDADDSSDGCDAGFKSCGNTCIDAGSLCCSDKDPSAPVVCDADQSCRMSDSGQGVVCGCGAGTKECNGGCIDADLECCDGAPTPFGCADGLTCKRGARTFTCECDGVMCGGSCLPEGSVCCDDARGSYCKDNRTCQRDAKDPSGFICIVPVPRGSCRYVETVSTACGSNSRKTLCRGGQFTLSQCQDMADDDSVCSGGCCWVYRYSQFTLVDSCE